MSKIAMNLQILEQTANQYWNIALHSPKLGRNEHIHITTAYTSSEFLNRVPFVTTVSAPL